MKCRKCKAELTRDEKRGCLVCLECSPPQATKPEPEIKDRSKYVDEPWTDERVKKIFTEMFPDAFREEMENWHIQKPPVTASEVAATVADNQIATLETKEPEKTWRDEAKELGVELYDHELKRPRKKGAVLADIASKTKEPALAGAN